MKPSNDLETFFCLFPDPDLARDLMNILEDFRIESRLKSEYPGLGPQINKINIFFLSRRPMLAELSGDTQRIVEIIGQKLSSGKTKESVPRFLKTALDFAVSISQSLETVNADIHYTARIAAELYFFIDKSFKDPYHPIAPFSASLDPTLYQQYVENLKNAAKGTLKKHPDEKENGTHKKDQHPGSHEKMSPSGAQTPQASAESQGQAKDQKNYDLAQIPELKGTDTNGKGESTEPQYKSKRPLIREYGIWPEDMFSPIDDYEPDKSDDLLHYLPFGLKEQNELEPQPGTFLYPEWGNDIGCYRANWSRVREHPLSASLSGFYQSTLKKYAGLIKKVKREFQMLRPEGMVKFKRQFDGDEIDLDSVVEYFIDRKLGISPSEKNYIRTRKNTRDIAVSFLIDMSGSTRGKTIALEKEALVIMSEALDELGDTFSIYGFSGYTRQNVAFYIIKDFSEHYDHRIAEKISAIRDKHSTRIGPALRHAALKLSKRDEKIKLLILLSDGKPEDREYYDAYGIEDTRAALKEGQKYGIRPFCITVDTKAPEYLHRMYSHSNWVVVNDVAKLPLKITRIYRQLTT